LRRLITFRLPGGPFWDADPLSRGRMTGGALTGGALIGGTARVSVGTILAARRATTFRGQNFEVTLLDTARRCPLPIGSVLRHWWWRDKRKLPFDVGRGATIWLYPDRRAHRPDIMQRAQAVPHWWRRYRAQDTRKSLRASWARHRGNYGHLVVSDVECHQVSAERRNDSRACRKCGFGQRPAWAPFPAPKQVTNVGGQRRART
jgi:hypothetical protein